MPYNVFTIPKRDGSMRTIEAPDDELKAKQREALKVLRKTFKVSPFAHAFQPYKNTVTCALPHVGKRWVGCIDIKDFFPSIRRDRFDQLKDQYKASIAVGFHECFHDFKEGKGIRLPQGAPTSPFLSNAYLFKFDWMMAWLAYNRKICYSRYADDLIFSGNSAKDIRLLFRISEQQLKGKYSLSINHKKTKMMHRRQRQLVCGIVVNEKINLPRKWRKNLRAEIFQKKRAGDIPEETAGRMAYREMVLQSKKTTLSSMDFCNSILVSRKLMGK